MDFVVNNWYLFIALFVVLFLLYGGPLMLTMNGIKMVNTAEAIRMINQDNAIVVDVGEPQEFQQGHIVNAINAPLGKLGDHITGLSKYKAKPIIVSCRSGQGSTKGALRLKKNGFEQVCTLSGGMMAWQRDSLPVEK